MPEDRQLHESIIGLMNKMAGQLAMFLGKILPDLSEEWWAKNVVNNLSFQQKQRIERNRITSLEALDLAALLRVLDQNWYPISTRLDLTSESRHFVKEMQSVRNRWAHASADGISTEDTYRDLDTLQRFGSVINADEYLLQQIWSAKKDVISGGAQKTGREKGNAQPPSRMDDASGTEFEPGQIVSLKTNPTMKGAVVSVLVGKPENRFKVFMDNKIQVYYASQLQAETQQDENIQILPCEHFHAYLTALQIRYPGLSTLYSLNAARVDFIPYQFRPVIKFIRSDRPRLLIADGVGVGKTIEAGLILRELQARREIRSVLIICPRPLVIECKWQTEMRRFEERFAHLDGGTLRYCINEMDLEGVWPEQYQKVIVPYSLFDEALLYGAGKNGNRKRRKGLLDLDPPPRFDLVIVDEAHHIRNQETYSHKAVKFFCDHAEAIVFLTATPIQLGSRDLFVLLNTLRPDLIIDQESFEHMAEPNPFINQAAATIRAQEPGWPERVVECLDQAAATSWGNAILKYNPEFKRMRTLISNGDISLEERVQLIDDIEGLHTFSRIINRTRRRDIGDFAVRKPETVTVEFTPAQKSLHDELLHLEMDVFRRLYGDVNVKFMMTTIRRQAASCIYGLAPFIEDILKRHLDELTWDEADNTQSVPSDDAVASIESRIQDILEKARKLDPYDPKLDSLRRIIRDKQSLPNNRVMIFSSFRHTLRYLYEHLSADGFRVGLIHGGVPDDERIELRKRFEKKREFEESLDVLLFSEIGCEGLDYQFCDCIVNYDLPWNPMRVEQRIGRIDRKGQGSESVVIVNLITPGTVDADIYQRCLVRIGVFNNSLGGSEEILGEITMEIKNIAENLTLSEEDRRLKLQQLADNKIRLIQEQEELEQRQLELFGIRLPKDQLNKDIEEASSFWLSSSSIQRLVVHYLQHSCEKEREFILGEKPLKTLRLSQDARNKLLHDFQQLARKNTSAYRDWENWLKGGSPHLSITFESECAAQNPEAAFIMPLHPLVKQAAMLFDINQRVITAVTAKDDTIPPGRYDFAIYQWQFHGIREDLILQPIASSPIVTEHLADLLKKVEADSTREDGFDASTIWDDLDDQHYILWSEARTKHQKRTQELAEFRRESLTTSHHARISLLEEQLKQASDDKIRKMRQAQITAAEGDYARRIQDLDIAMERADITAEPVGYGVICIERCTI